MTRTLNTIPDEAAPLKAAKKSKSSNAKGILAAAATVSFIFGLLAATAVTPAPTGVSVAFDSQDLGRGQAVAAAAARSANAQEPSSHLETLGASGCKPAKTTQERRMSALRRDRAAT